ncbi:beta-glucosidase BglX [Pedobacter cryophilus]|uniref:Periplasmic beta-glucosidase n=1 Tax=Pedobacter cryophilus TaxID=2571271 RepID=A0A4U1C6A1_9SPHI|nr:beta-glucosidase BglX [Pedobacter cryophilus]TKC00144.1 beta-glucosidase BglX [Pedobacter cryophilus]
MKLLKYILTFGVLTAVTACVQQKQIASKTAIASTSKMDIFIADLMSKMTVEEKIGQLNLLTGGEAITGSTGNSDLENKVKRGEVGGFFSLTTPERVRKAQDLAVNYSRLKIPLIFGLDVIHGYKTTFPIPLAMSATWDMELIKKTAQIAAEEAAADGINWTFSPMVDISRDPRWGRFSEGSGEDPFLGSEIARAMVKGYQGDDLTKINTIMACVKHFALYGAGEGGRDYNTVDMSKVRMYNEYLAPYKAAIDAGAGSVMTSFNEIDGVPATANKWLVTDLLRNQWQFKGFVVTDYTGINEMVDHGFGNLQQVSALSLNAGVDMDMVGEGFLTTLKKSLNENKVSKEEIDRACRYVLEAKYKLGLFEDPFKYCNDERARTKIFTKENIAASREAATKSFVLLRNENNLLPLKKTAKIALVGPLADSKVNMPGTWSVSTDLSKAISVKQGLEEAVGNKAQIIYALGSNLLEDIEYQKRATMFGRDMIRDNRAEETIIQEAVDAALKADIVVAALGESSEMSGESSSRSDIQIPAIQKRLLAALLKTGKPVVLLVFNGRPLDLTYESKNVPAILNVWFGGTETGHAIADVLFGDVNPSGKLSATFPQNVGQVPLYYNHKNTGRPLEEGKWFTKFKSNYLDVSNDPLYPFGFGLSYTTFEISAPVLNQTTLGANGSISVTVKVKNAGNRDGEEVVQLYIRDLVGSITRPVKELKGFQKIALKAGETKEVTFKLTEEHLKFYNSNLEFVSEPGDFKVFVGNSVANVKEASFKLVK